MWLALPIVGAPSVSWAEFSEGDEGRPPPMTPTLPLIRAAFSRSFSRRNRGGLSCWCWERPWRRRLGGRSKPLGGKLPPPPPLPPESGRLGPLQVDVELLEDSWVGATPFSAQLC